MPAPQYPVKGKEHKPQPDPFQSATCANHGPYLTVCFHCHYRGVK